MGRAKLSSRSRLGAGHWRFRSQTSAVAEHAERFGGGMRSEGIFVGILGPGHKPHMRWARMYLE